MSRSPMINVEVRRSCSSLAVAARLPAVVAEPVVLQNTRVGTKRVTNSSPRKPKKMKRCRVCNRTRHGKGQKDCAFYKFQQARKYARKKRLSVQDAARQAFEEQSSLAEDRYFVLECKILHLDGKVNFQYYISETASRGVDESRNYVRIPSWPSDMAVFPLYYHAALILSLAAFCKPFEHGKYEILGGIAFSVSKETVLKSFEHGLDNFLGQIPLINVQPFDSTDNPAVIYRLQQKASFGQAWHFDSDKNSFAFGGRSRNQDNIVSLCASLLLLGLVPMEFSSFPEAEEAEKRFPFASWMFPPFLLDDAKKKSQYYLYLNKAKRTDDPSMVSNTIFCLVNELCDDASAQRMEVVSDIARTILVHFREEDECRLLRLVSERNDAVLIRFLIDSWKFANNQEYNYKTVSSIKGLLTATWEVVVLAKAVGGKQETNSRSAQRIAFHKNDHDALKKSVREALTNDWYWRLGNYWQKTRWITYKDGEPLLALCESKESQGDNSAKTTKNDRKKRATNTTTTTTVTGNIAKKA